MVLFTLCMSSMHGVVRFVSEAMHPFEIAFFRIVFSLLVVVPWFVKLGWEPLRTRRLGMLGLRGALNAVCMLAFFYSLAITPLAEVTALLFSAPIFATVLAIFVFGETLGARRWAAIGIGFVGTLVVLRPGVVEVGLGPALALFAAAVWAVCMIIIKSLGRTESSVTITVYMVLVMAPLSLVPALFVWQWPTAAEIGWLVVIGILGGAGQMAMAEALRIAETHAVMPVDFMKLIWVSVIAYLAFGEVPGPFTLAGGAMIFGSTAFIAYRERRLKGRTAPRAEPT